jgi:hypothetical protein
MELYCHYPIAIHYYPIIAVTQTLMLLWCVAYYLVCLLHLYVVRNKHNSTSLSQNVWHNQLKHEGTISLLY